MPKLSVVLKNDENLIRLCQCFPLFYPKVRRTSRLFLWRLDEGRLNVLQQQLIDEFRLVLADLHDLCERGDAESLWLLSSQGFNAKMRDHEGATLLQKATHSGKTAILKLVVEKGGNVNAKGAYGYTPLHEACYIGHEAVTQTLLALRANVDALSKNGSTPLLVAAREGHTRVVELLLRGSAHGDDGGDKGWTPLAVAAGEGHLEVCSTLIRYNANVQGFGGDGRYERSALQEAAEQGHTGVVVLLLEHRADVLHAFDEGAGAGGGAGGTGARVTAYDLAKRNKHDEVATLLVAHGGGSEVI